MSKLRNVAVVGFAQLPVVARDEHRTATEMLYPVVRQALQECGVHRDGIDYQIAGSTDYMDGRPFGFVAALDVMGAWPPRQDLHLEMDASFCAYYAWVRMQAGECDTAIVVGHGKTSEGDPQRVLNLQLDPYYQAPLGLDPTSTAALQASAFLARGAATAADLAAVAARNRNNGVRNPDNQLRSPTTANELAQSPWAVEPLRQGYLPPVGETATCMVLAAEGKAETLCDKPVWIHGVDHRTELQTLGARDLSRSAGAKLAAERALAMAGLAKAGDVDVIELMAANPAEELILLEALGVDPRAGKPSINPSGGALCANPVMSTGLIRLGETFRQLSGRAGEHGVAGASRALAHAAQGHCLQTNIFWVVGSQRRWS
ncbi:MAG: lipid-transfer protein [Deltaproteobacteria bacterium]|nr:lipid-transfer protein [Deltaproteobacteria bacterium]